MSSYPGKRALFRYLIACVLNRTLSRKQVAEWVAFECKEHGDPVEPEELLSSCEWTLRHLDELPYWTTQAQLQYYQQCLRGERPHLASEPANIRGAAPLILKASLGGGVWAEIYTTVGYRGIVLVARSPLVIQRVASAVHTEEFRALLLWFQVRTATFPERNYYLVRASRLGAFLRELRLFFAMHLPED